MDIHSVLNRVSVSKKPSELPDLMLLDCLKTSFILSLGGAAQLAGIQTALVKNNEDGTFNLDELRQRIRKNPDFHEPVTSLIVVENTHNMCGGKVSHLKYYALVF